MSRGRWIPIGGAASTSARCRARCCWFWSSTGRRVGERSRRGGATLDGREKFAQPNPGRKELEKALAAVRAYAARQEELRTANPGKKEFEDRARRGEELVKREERDGSRLFAIDAGVDIAVLRAKYPDRSKYAIVRGLVRPVAGWDEKTPQLSGYVSDLSIKDVSVPKDLRKHLPGPRKQYALPPSSSYEITLAIGKRLEPWVMAVSPPAAP